ncbi:hypothetical protein [Streptomyces sp. KLOTTS4A1]|uniref:hypothetical protein n=1 Tax=Streptomyces sp. KLOTTS4A1 TaxID=3390996 RepID=UPI0039F45FC6
MNDEDLHIVATEDFTLAPAARLGAGGAQFSAGSHAPSLRARARMQELVLQLRSDLVFVTDSRERTLFATTADLLVSLDAAFAEVATPAAAEPTETGAPAWSDDDATLTEIRSGQWERGGPHPPP